MSEDLTPLLDDAGERRGVRSLVLDLREAMFAELGVPLPPPRIRVDARLPARHVVMTIFEVPAKLLALPEGTADADAPLAIARDAGNLLRRRAADFLGLAETQRLLDELEQFAPAVVRNVVGKPVPLTLLVDILRRLVEEGICIRDLRAILEALATAAVTEKDPLTLSEYVRGHFRRMITYRLTRGASYLNVFLLEPAIEERIKAAITHTANGSFLTLSPAQSREIVAGLRRAVADAAGKLGDEQHPIVILTQQISLRRFVKKLIDVEFPDAVVTSHAELLPEIALREVARVRTDGAPAH